MTAQSLFSLEGKNAIVTGAGRGLGRGMASALASAGAKVALVARSEQELHSTASDIGTLAAPLRFDIGGNVPFSSLVDDAENILGGAIDIVVHAAGIQHRESAEAFARSDWQHVLDINLTAPYFLSQEVGKRQIAAGRQGSHIFVGSLTSHLSIPSTIAYTASKSGIYGVLRALSLEWSGRGIRANGIGPGYIRTRMTEAVFNDAARSKELFQRIPMGRFGTPDDMAGAVIFLASGASAYVTGQLLMVDGGWSAS